MDEVTPARVSALEAQVSTLSEFLAISLVLTGRVTEHLGMILSGTETAEDAVKRTRMMGDQLFAVYERFSALFPDLPEVPPPPP